MSISESALIDETPPSFSILSYEMEALFGGDGCGDIWKFLTLVLGEAGY